MKRNSLYTVIAFFDGDYHVQTFVEHVKAFDAGDAFDQCKKRLIREGRYCKSDLENLTEIVTYSGWLQ